jgi:hypothetical protein
MQINFNYILVFSMIPQEKEIFNFVFTQDNFQRIEMNEFEKNDLFRSFLKFYKNFKQEIESSVEFQEVGKLSKLIPDYDFETLSMDQ